MSFEDSDFLKIAKIAKKKDKIEDTKRVEPDVSPGGGGGGGN